MLNGLYGTFGASLPPLGEFDRFDEGSFERKAREIRCQPVFLDVALGGPTVRLTLEFQTLTALTGDIASGLRVEATRGWSGR